MSDRGALAGVRVLDVTRVLAGPLCGAILADLGAEVIKVEQPGTGDDSRQYNPFVAGESSYFMNFNRNKKGITLDLKKGKEIFLRMVRDADVVVENFKPGTMTKLGLDYECLKAINPRIIYAAISGFGQSGPYHELPGYDLIGQAMSGIMSVTGEADGEPLRAGGPICDVMGGMTGALGILAALNHRHATGRGQMVDISLVDAVVASMTTINQHYLVDGRIPQRRGNSYESAAPADSYRASDGWFVITVGNDKLWRALVDLMEAPDLLEMAAFTSNYDRVRNARELKTRIEAWSQTRTVDDLVAAMIARGIPAAPILDVGRVCTDPHIAGARGMFVEVDHPKAGRIKLTNSALRLSETDACVRTPPPVLGEHNEQIYGEVLGFDADEIAALRTSKTI